MEKLTAKHIWIHVGIVLAASAFISTVAIFSYMAMNPTPKPLPKFSNYDECAQGGGALTNATHFSACIGADNELFLQYSAQNLPRIQERKANTSPNHVVAGADTTVDLVSFLKQDYSGCVASVGYYKVLKEVKNRFAVMNYGCDNYTEGQKASANIIAMKLADGWVLLSPTDNMQGTMPSCLLADMFKISKQLSAKCFETTGYNDGSLRDVTYQ